MPSRKQKLSNLNNANYFEFPRAVLVIMNILRAIEANPAEMHLLCVAAVIHWELKTGILAALNFGVLVIMKIVVLSMRSYRLQKLLSNGNFYQGKL